MANVSITAANVKKGAGAAVEKSYTAGEAIAAGQTTYRKSSDGKLYLAQADGAAEEAQANGIALNNAAADQPITIQTAGKITIGGTVVVGGVYAVSATAGAIAPIADLASSDYVTILGTASTAGILDIDISVTGIEKP